MRKWVILFVFLAGAVYPGGAGTATVTRMVTVHELEQAIADSHSMWDWRLGTRISQMKLTERLSADKLSRLQAEVHGARAREALIALADESAFLDLPAAEVPSKPAPEASERAAMLALSVESVKKAIASWPDFIATRQMTRFEGTDTVIFADLQDEIFSSAGSVRAPPAASWECPGEPKVGHQRLSVIDQTSVTVVDREGQELHALGERGGEFECPENGVSTTEEFGKVLSWVPKIVAHGSVDWSHWEYGASGLLAVFRYSVLVSHKSMPIDIHGEIALNPADGSIMRLTEIRRWTKHEDPSDVRAAYDRVVEYDSAVEYGPVNIGGSLHICPLKRVAMYRAPILRPRGVDKQTDALYQEFGLTESPLQEYLNDITFTQYRLYGMH